MKANNTRVRTKEIAFQLFKEGIRPSINKVREQLGGKGGQAAIQESLDEWWLELSEDYQCYSSRENIPEEAFDFIDKLWSMLTDKAQLSFKQERDEIQQQLQKQQQTLVAERKLYNDLEKLLLEVKDKLQHSEAIEKSLQQQLSLSNTVNQKLEEEQGFLNIQIEQQLQRIAQIESLFQQLQNEKNTLIKKQEHTVIQLENQLNQYRDEITQKQAEFSELKLQYQTAQQSIEIQNETLQKSESENSQLYHKNIELKQTIEMLNESLDHLAKQYQQGQHQLEQQQIISKQQYQTVIEYSHTIKELTANNQLSESKVQQLNQQINTMKATEELIKQLESKLDKNPKSNV